MTVRAFGFGTRRTGDRGAPSRPMRAGLLALMLGAVVGQAGFSAPAPALAVPAGQLEVDANGRFVEPVELTIQSRVTTTDAALPGEDWFWYEAVKRDLNIDVSIEFVTEPDQYLPVLQARAAANNLADLSEPDAKTLAQLVDQGLVADWTPYLELMPEYIESHEVTELSPSGTFDGQLFGLTGHVVFPFKPNMTIRQDWLNNLGLEMPTTTDEYLEVMRAFTFDDPDGNGVDDTYGFSAAVQDNGSLAQMDPIFGAFDACCTGSSVGDWRLIDGELVATATSDRRRAALEFVNQMVEAGVIDPDWKAQKQSDFRNKWREGTVGVFYDDWCAIYCVNNYPLFGEANPTGALVIGPPPVGPEGLSASGAYSKANLNQMPVISTQAAESGKAEAAARLLEWMAGPGYLLTVYGEEGVGYNVDAEGNVIPVTDNALLTDRQMSRWAQKGGDEEWFARYNQDVEQGDGSTYNVYEDVLQRVFELPLTDVTELAPLPPIPGDSAADLVRTISEGEFAFASGDRPFDEWDAHVETVRANGLDAWQAAVDARAQELGLIE